MLTVKYKSSFKSTVQVPHESLEINKFQTGYTQLEPVDTVNATLLHVDLHTNA
jgi:hypothetical protein